MGEAKIFDLVRSDFSESCSYMYYLLGDVVLYISLMSLLHIHEYLYLCI